MMQAAKVEDWLAGPVRVHLHDQVPRHLMRPRDPNYDMMQGGYMLCYAMLCYATS